MGAFKEDAGAPTTVFAGQIEVFDDDVVGVDEAHRGGVGGVDACGDAAVGFDLDVVGGVVGGGGRRDQDVVGVFKPVTLKDVGSYLKERDVQEIRL